MEINISHDCNTREPPWSTGNIPDRSGVPRDGWEMMFPTIATPPVNRGIYPVSQRPVPKRDDPWECAPALPVPCGRVILVPGPGGGLEKGFYPTRYSATFLATCRLKTYQQWYLTYRNITGSHLLPFRLPGSHLPLHEVPTTPPPISYPSGTCL